MDQQKRSKYATDIRFRIKHLEKAQERDETSLNDLKQLSIDPVLARKKEQEIRERISNRKEKIKELIQRESDVYAGHLDKEIEEERSKESHKVREKGKIIHQKKREEREEKERKKKEMYASFRRQRRNYSSYRGPSQRDMQYHEKRFFQISGSLPHYMKRNLSDMPNNKGYIWKNCWFLGLNPKEPYQPQIMFEKLRGGILRIHEYNEHEYKLFEKKGKERKKLIEKKRCIHRPNAPNRWVRC